MGICQRGFDSKVKATTCSYSASAFSVSFNFNFSFTLQQITLHKVLIYGNQQVEFVDIISKHELPVQIFSLNGLYELQQNKPLDPCPYFVEPLTEYDRTNTVVIPEDEIFIRDPLIPIKTYRPTYLIWVENLEKMLQIFDNTILRCDQIMEVGIYRESAQFLIIMEQEENDLEKVFDYNENLKLHPHVAIIQSLPLGMEQKFKVYGYNFFEDGSTEILLNFIWSKSNPFQVVEDIFTDMSQFRGIFQKPFHSEHCGP